MEVWQKGMDLAVEIFNMTCSLPKCEDYGLTPQIRRASCSVHANIAEGFGRSTKPDKSRFYIISKGSATETQSHIEYGKRVKYFKDEKADAMIENYQNLIHDLNKLIKSLSNSQSQPQPQP